MTRYSRTIALRRESRAHAEASRVETSKRSARVAPPALRYSLFEIPDESLGERDDVERWELAFMKTERES
jgi:hypothetical protein